MQEGKFRKLVRAVRQISYNGPLAMRRGQHMWYVTERCVFELAQHGLMLTEVAKGIELERDILSQMDFRPLIAEKLGVVPPCVYKDGAFGLREIILQK